MLMHWVKACLQLSRQPADFYSGARKILRNRSFSFPDLNPALKIQHCGYTKSKMTMLHRLYFHDESIQVAHSLWERRLSQAKYGSVGFTTYAHFIKNDPDKKSKRASVMGPCIQSVVLTLMPDKSTQIDTFYRTTEIFKKFPADLVFLRDDLLKDFQLNKVSQVNFHFANITCHPMYFVTLIPHLQNPPGQLDLLKGQDKYFYDWVVKWTARYLCPENQRGIQKFAQAMRVHKDAHDRIDAKTLKELQRYLRANHPGYRNDYEDPNDEGEEQ